MRCVNSLEKRLSPVKKVKPPNSLAAKLDLRLSWLKRKGRGKAGKERPRTVSGVLKYDSEISREVGDRLQNIQATCPRLPFKPRL